MTPPLTVTMPMRGTPREMQTAPRALASVSALRPAQLVVGLDADAPPSLDVFIRENVSCKCDIVRVARDPAWNAHLPHVVWEMIAAADNDLIICTDADLILSGVLLERAGLAGTGNMAAVTFSVAPGTPGPVGAYRRLMFRLRRRFGRRKAVTGLYAIWRPFYYSLVTRDAMMSIRNGVDSIIWIALEGSAAYDYLFTRQVGAVSLDDQTGDYPYSQFSAGLRMAAQRAPHRALARCAYTAALHAWPWYVYGCLWALAHPRHPVVAMCATATQLEFDRNVMPRILRLRKWGRSVRERTGFCG